MKTLVIGANGLLGSNVLEAVKKSGGEPVGTYHTSKPSFDAPCHKVDIRDRGLLAEVLDRTHPDRVVNCAAMTDVDGCEERPEHSYEVNAEAPGMIATICTERDIHFTHVSTDYVFGGEAQQPYTINSSPNPVQAYGRSKLAGERAVQESHPDSTIVRLSFVYGIHQGSDELEGFPAWVRARLQRKEPTPLFTDQWVTPTRAGQAAETILELYDTGATGLYHVACQSCVTPHGFGDRIRTMMGISSELVKEGSLEDINRTADRPAYSCLDVSSVEETLDRPQPSLDDDLEEIKETLD